MPRTPADAPRLADLLEEIGVVLRDVDVSVDALPVAESARRLAAAVLDRSPAAVALDAERGARVTMLDAERIRAAVERAGRGMPFAYAVGTAAFRHLLLRVDERVLIPRPETEIVVEHALRCMAGAPGGVAVDIGTGSGAIALALAQEGAFDRVVATDVSADALAVARMNAERIAAVLRAPVEFRLGADLAPVSDLAVSLLVSNPPYIAYHEAAALPAAVRDWEPPTALFAADQGMARYSALLQSAPAVLVPGAWVVLECDARRAEETAAIAERTGAYEQVTVHPDLAGRPRVLTARFGG